MSENIEEIKAFYQNCNKLLKDITIEWIKEDGSTGETIKGDEVLEYIEFNNHSCNMYDTKEKIEYGSRPDNQKNKSYKCFYEIYSENKTIGFQNIKDNKLSLSNRILCGTCHGYNGDSDFNIYAEHREYKDCLQGMYNDNNGINQDINQKILSVIVMLLNSIDYKFYKFSDENLFINLSSGLENDFKEYKDKTPYYKTLQVKYNTNIIFKMTINNYKDQIFNCIYNYNDKIIKFDLIDFHSSSLYYYNNYNYHGYKLYSISKPFLNHPYGHRVFYNVIYSLENKLTNQVSETSKNQYFIKDQNYNNQLLQKNQEIEELKRLLQEKSNFNEIQDNLINSLIKSLKDFKEKYENQLKIHQEEFEKLKIEYNEKYNYSLIEFYNNSDEIKKLKDENNKLKQENETIKLTNKQKLDEILSENNQLKEENYMFNKELIEIIQIYNENFNYINKVSKTDLIQLKETLTRILDNNINLNKKLKQKEDKIKKLQGRMDKLHDQNDKLNDEINRLKTETQQINLYKKQLIELSKNILNLQVENFEDI